MKKTKSNNNGQMILIIICLFYTVGVCMGFLFAEKLGSYFGMNLNYFGGNKFYNSFFYFAKFAVPIWIAGIFSVGIFFIVPWCAICGVFYGVSANNLSIAGNTSAFMLNAIEFAMFTAAVFIFSASAINLSLGRYKSFKNPKMHLQREKYRVAAEHLIIMCIGLALMFCAAGLKSTF